MYFSIPLRLHIFVCTCICSIPHQCGRFKVLKIRVFLSALEHPFINSMKNQKTQGNRTFHGLLRNTKHPEHRVLMLDSTMQENCLKLQEEHIISHLIARVDVPWKALDSWEKNQFQNSKHYANKDRVCLKMFTYKYVL